MVFYFTASSLGKWIAGQPTKPGDGMGAALAHSYTSKPPCSARRFECKIVPRWTTWLFKCMDRFKHLMAEKLQLLREIWSAVTQQQAEVFVRSARSPFWRQAWWRPATIQRRLVPSRIYFCSFRNLDQHSYMDSRRGAFHSSCSSNAFFRLEGARWFSICYQQPKTSHLFFQHKMQKYFASLCSARDSAGRFEAENLVQRAAETTIRNIAKPGGLWFQR